MQIMRLLLLLGGIAFLQGCDPNRFVINPCITKEKMEWLYGDMLDQVEANRSLPQESIPNDVYMLSFDGRRFDRQARARVARSRHEYSDKFGETRLSWEYRHGARFAELFSYKSSPYGYYLSVEPRPNTLFSNMMRGYITHPERRIQVIAYSRYGKLNNTEIYRTFLLANYDYVRNTLVEPETGHCKRLE